MRHLVLALGYPPVIGGIEIMLHEIAQRLSGEVTVVCRAAPGAQGMDSMLGLDVRRAPEVGASLALRLFSRLASRWLHSMVVSSVLMAPLAFRVAQEVQPDVVHCGHLYLGPLARRIGQRLGKPYVIYLYGKELMAPSLVQERWIHRWLVRRILSPADRLFVISEFTRGQSVGWGGDESRMVKVPIGIDSQRFRPPSDPDTIRLRLGLSGRKVILTVGRLVSRKGHDAIIDVLPTVVRQAPDVLYLVVGEGPEWERLEDLAASRGVGDLVRFQGRVADTLPYYQACDVFAMPGRSIMEEGDVEGFGIVFLEASACAKPVVAGRAGGMPEAVVDGVTGLLVDPDDRRGLTDALIRLLTYPAESRRLGANGRHWVETERTWDRTVAVIQEHLEATKSGRVQPDEQESLVAGDCPGTGWRVRVIFRLAALAWIVLVFGVYFYLTLIRMLPKALVFLFGD